MKLLELPDELIFYILEYFVNPNHHYLLLHNPNVLRIATLQSINKQLSTILQDYCNSFWRSLLVHEFGTNPQFIKLIDEQQELKTNNFGLKRISLLLRKLAMQDIDFSKDSLDCCKICVTGMTASGKSSLCAKFVTGNFIENMDPTIEDSYRKSLEIDGHSLYLDILDTAGQEEYRAMRDSIFYVYRSYIVMASYDVKVEEWKEYFEELMHQISRSRYENTFAILFVVNKSDLKKEDRKSTFEEWKNLFDLFIDKLEITNYDFIEASVKLNINVDKIFELETRMFFHAFFPHVQLFEQVIQLDTNVFKWKTQQEQQDNCEVILSKKKKCSLQ